MTRRSCLSSEQWGRALDGDRAFDAHLTECASCKSEHAALMGMRTELAKLPAPSFDAPRVRARILHTLQVDDGRVRLVRASRALGLMAAAAALAVVIGVLFLRRSERSRSLDARAATVGSAPVVAALRMRVRVHADDTARYVSIGTPEDAVLRLFDGRVTIEVDRLGNGERYRVVTDDAEVEVRGTSFEVRSVEGRLDSVRVFHGRVEVRVATAPAIAIDAGGTWSAPVRADAAPIVPIVRPVVAPALLPIAVEAAQSFPKVTPRPPLHTDQPAAVGEMTGPDAAARDVDKSVVDVAFEHAWSALRAGRHGTAARLFGEVPEGSALAEDALFWQSVALLRAGEVEVARVLLDRFRSRYPHSGRLSDVDRLLERGGGRR